MIEVEHLKKYYIIFLQVKFNNNVVHAVLIITTVHCTDQIGSTLASDRREL